MADRQPGAGRRRGCVPVCRPLASTQVTRPGGEHDHPEGGALSPGGRQCDETHIGRFPPGAGASGA
ncbi:hypothetical protein SBRY_90209 [Actinacidiphila bryophytorum]|uniref:Uncharacterized protein n=1 Tax=Actinacidiphila bryophytorum TaxID=1436133 RepID=A0A9W4MLB2_9ACTN|nr:hypothetical protein SBRY_90209 [Actinacidiphila bryophytorum]